MGKHFASDLAREGDIGEIDLRRFLQVADEIVCRCLERRVGTRRQNEQLFVGSVLIWLNLRRLLEHDMGVGSSDAKGADTGPARMPILQWPIHELRRNKERTFLEINLRVRMLIVQGLRNLPVLYGHHAFDQTRNTGGGAQVSDVAFE